MSIQPAPSAERRKSAMVSVYVNGKHIPDGIFMQQLFIKGAMNFTIKAELTLLTDRPFDPDDFEPLNPVAILVNDGEQEQFIFEGLIATQNITAIKPEGSSIRLLCLTAISPPGVEEPYTLPLENVPGPFLTLTLGTDIIDYSITQCQEPDPYNPEWFCGRFRFPGSALAAIHTRIQIDEKLQPYRNEYPYIAGVEHRLENGIWTSTVELGKAGRVNLKDW